MLVFCCAPSLHTLRGRALHGLFLHTLSTSKRAEVVSYAWPLSNRRAVRHGCAVCNSVLLLTVVIAHCRR